MKRFFLKCLAIAFPWMVFFILDNPGGGLVAMVMQATLIGWPFASIWALRALRESNDTNPKKSSETE